MGTRPALAALEAAALIYASPSESWKCSQDLRNIFASITHPINIITTIIAATVIILLDATSCIHEALCPDTQHPPPLCSAMV